MKKRFVQYKSGTVLDTKTGDIYGPNKVIISNLGEEEHRQNMRLKSIQKTGNVQYKYLIMLSHFVMWR